MNKVAAFALRRKNSVLSMSEKMFCPPQPLRFWITPACAGKRRSDWIIRSIYWDHPPRMRGKDTILNRVNPRPRITPACAGKSQSPFPLQRPARDHPRMCGEKPSQKGCGSCPAGSSPRMRGKGASGIVCDFVHGITPACAGKRDLRSRFCPAGGDHPRACGEKSSPR